MAETSAINQLIIISKKYDDIRKTAIGDYSTGCLLDYQYFKIITN